MRVLLPLLAILALGVAAAAGAGSPNLRFVLLAVVPYACAAAFVAGVVFRVVGWARSPVPFRIPTTCGQQKSLPWFKANNLENPHSLWGVLGRMALEVLLFRSLFRNTETTVVGDGKVTIGPTKWLWAAGLVFHWSFLVILLRHLRFFVEPVPSFVLLLQKLDGLFEVAIPVVYGTTVAFLVALTYLFIRRVAIPRLRYLSLPADYFPLFVLLGIGASGGILRHITKTDVVAVKDVALGLVQLQPIVVEGLHPFFYVHLMLVCVLLAIVPHSKLMHFAGVFFSPTRNLANSNRAKRHINPWNAPVEVHSYAAYEDEFRDRMKSAGIPVDKE